MSKKTILLSWLCIICFCLGGLYPVSASAQIYPYPYSYPYSYSGTANPLLSTSYLALYLNPYYYNTSVPVSSFGQFDPSISLDEVTLSPEILYSPTPYRTYTPSSLQGLYNFSPSPFNYIWNSLLASQDNTITVNPYFATPFYYPILNKDYFSTNPGERTVPLSLYTLYSFSSHLPELFYNASQAGLVPTQNFINALGLSLLPII